MTSTSGDEPVAEAPEEPGGSQPDAEELADAQPERTPV